MTKAIGLNCGNRTTLYEISLGILKINTIENGNRTRKKGVNVGVEGINITFIHSEKLRHTEKS